MFHGKGTSQQSTQENYTNYTSGTPMRFNNHTHTQSNRDNNNNTNKEEKWCEDIIYGKHPYQLVY